MKYHPILMMMDEDRITTAAKVDGLRSPNTGAIGAYALWLADRVGERGIRSCESEVQRLARVARSSGLCCVALNVLADPAVPAVARERALGQVIPAILQLRDEPSTADAA